MRYDSEHKQRTRTKVLDAAARAIRHDGPQGIAVGGVMAAAGLTHGGFYAHFESKDALVAAAIDHMFEEARGRVRKAAQGLGPAQALGSYIDLYLCRKHRDARALGCPMASLASDLPRLGDAARERFAAGVRGVIAAIGEKLAELGYADPEAEADSLVAELVGALALARVEPSAKRSEAILAASRERLKRRFGLTEAAA